jgi:hypothetical protein
MMVAIASAAPLHGCSCTPPVAIATLVVAGTSIGSCLGFLAAALFHVGE